MNFYLHIAFCVLIIQFINSWFWDGMIFWRIGDNLEENFPKVFKGLFGCAICMSLYWGVLYFVIARPELNIVLFIGAVGGINVLIHKFTKDDS